MIKQVKNKSIAWYDGLTSQCHHSRSGKTFAVLYCITLAACFVAALYILVPPKVRGLDRDHPKQIQWRTLSSFIVCAVAIGTYPLFFCDLNGPAAFSIVDIFFHPQHVKGVLLHTVVLYLGPIASGLLRVYDSRKRMLARGKKPRSYPEEVFRKLIKPTLVSFTVPYTEVERWRNIRNFIVAPLTEEVVFRGCMVPALLSTGLSPLAVSLVAPLFFGIAHAHHAFTKLAKGEQMAPVVMMTVFQFAYTSLFGAYASYAFIRTGSIGAVTLSHSYCNWMGLPDLSFMQARHPMHSYRFVLLSAFLIGVFGFKWCFRGSFFLPLPAVVPATLQMDILLE